MSSLESDSAVDEFEDSRDDTDDDDGVPDLDDSHQLTSLFNSLLSTVDPSNISSYNIQAAFGFSSTPSDNTASSSSVFDDSIRTYVETSSLFQPATNPSAYYLTIDRITHQSDKLFVANINYQATTLELKTFFVNLNYDVVDVKCPRKSNKVRSFLFCRLTLSLLI